MLISVSIMVTIVMCGPRSAGARIIWYNFSSWSLIPGSQMIDMVMLAGRCWSWFDIHILYITGGYFLQKIVYCMNFRFQKDCFEGMWRKEKMTISSIHTKRLNFLLAKYSPLPEFLQEIHWVDCSDYLWNSYWNQSRKTWLDPNYIVSFYHQLNLYVV